MSKNSPATPAVGNPRMLTFFLAILSSIPSACLTVYTPALPEMATHFGTTDNTARSIQTGFAVANAFLQMMLVFFYAPLADRLGRKCLTISSLIVFSIGSIGCTLANGIDQFIFWRIIQGLGACAGPAVARTIVEDVFKDKQREKAHNALWIGLIASPAAALLVSSVFLRHGGILPISLFLTIAGLSMLAFAFLHLHLPEIRPREAAGKNSIRPSTLQNSRKLLADRAFMIPTLIMAFNLAGAFAYQSDIAFVFAHTFGMRTGVDVWLIGNSAALTAIFYWIKEWAVENPQSRIDLALATLRARWIVTLILLSMACSGLAERWLTLALLLLYHLSLGLIFGKLQSDALNVHDHLTSTATGLYGALLNSGVLLGTALPLLPLATDFTRMATTLFFCASLACVLSWNYRQILRPQST